MMALGIALLLAGSAPVESPTLIVVVGAEGAPEYGQAFAAWAKRWTLAGQRAGASTIVIGTGPAADPPERARLERLLGGAAHDSAAELWIVLIGHGTFDGRTARFNLRGPDVAAAELAEWLAPLRRPVIVVNSASCSGPFVAALSGPNRIVITATRSGFEQNYCRFGDYFSQAIGDLAADLDKDGQVSLLEAFLDASRRVQEFYQTEARLASEHALLDDNGDGRGIEADWFRGLRLVKIAADDKLPDGQRAHQIHLLKNERERRIPPALRAQRDALELQIAAWREQKPGLEADDYYRRLEELLLQLARLNDAIDNAQVPAAPAKKAPR